MASSLSSWARVLPAGAALLLGCAPTVPSGALAVSLTFAPSSRAHCARLEVTAGERVTLSGELRRRDRPVVTALYREPGTPEEVSLRALGFSSTRCEGEPVERSAPAQARFAPGEVVKVSLQLAGAGEVCEDGVDNDGNGAADCQDAPCACDGGVCGASGRCLPPSAEVCDDRVDNDGDLATDCADSDCGVAFCDGGVCTPAGECVPANLERCADGVDNDSDGKVDCEDADCLGASCDGGLCLEATCKPGERSCSDGADDDGDGQRDCDDPDCLSRPCTAANLCLQGTVCTGPGACGGGSLKPCPPPDDCLGPGTCAASSGRCSYPQLPSGSDCDGGRCSGAGQCDPLFPFFPSNFPVPPPSRFSDAGYVDCQAEVGYSQNKVVMTWCGANAPTPIEIALADNTRAVLVPVRELRLTRDAGIRLVGERPVIFAVLGDAVVDGWVNAGAWLERPGAGGNRASCGFGVGTDGTWVGATSGGGGGGALGGLAGDGGHGAAGGVGGKGGAPTVGLSTLVPLGGGCPGGAGGGAGGAGGGAVQLSVSGRLTVSGWISAQGGGGRPGDQTLGGPAGGGGGGSGGAILLEAKELRLESSARITANGGGGGEGDGNAVMPGGNTEAGTDGHPDSDLPAPGGNGATTLRGGPGGAGGAGTTPGGDGHDGGSGTGSGGGGGGSVGILRFNVVGSCRVDKNAVMSPPATGNQQGCP